MKTLDKKFNKNGMSYEILERSETRYFASVSSLESGKLCGYETGRIVIGKAVDTEIQGKKVKFGSREHIIGNEQFGQDKFECFYGVARKLICYSNYQKGVKADLEKISAK